MRFIEAVNDIPRKGYIRTLFYITDNDDCSRFKDVKSGELCELKIDVSSPILKSISNYKLKFVKLQEVYQHDSLYDLIEYLDNNDYDYSIRRSCDGIELETRKFEEGIKIEQDVDIDGNLISCVVEDIAVEDTTIPTTNIESNEEETVSNTTCIKIENIDDYIDEETLDVTAIVDDDIRAMSSTKSALSRYDEIINYKEYIDDDYYNDEDDYEEYLDRYRESNNVSDRYRALERYI